MRNIECLHVLQKGLELGLFFAIAVLPLSLKVPIGPISLHPTELVLLILVPFLIPGLIKALRGGLWGQPFKASSLFILATFLSAIISDNSISAVKESIQIALYAVIAPLALKLAFRDRPNVEPLRKALYCSLALSFALLVFNGFFYEGEAELITGGPIGGIWQATIILVFLTTLFGTRIRNTLSFDWHFAILLTGLISVFVGTTWVASNPPTGESINTSAVPQRYLEAYAALSVLHDRPLYGLGPGNYQDHIGEYYQGLPKENTILYGTRIGWTHTAASLGLLGTTAFAFWLRILWKQPRNRLPIAAICLAGLVTPLLNGNILITLSILTGLRDQNERADS